MTFRMCFDKARQNIRIHWNAHLLPRQVFGGSRTTLYVDGISVYELDKEDGKIVQHRIEQLLINNTPVRPKEGVFVALRDQHTVTIPSFARSSNNQVAEFQSWSTTTNHGDDEPSSLFAVASNDDYPNLDWDALDRKNKSRQKFGLEPLTPEEFLDIEAKVQAMESQNRAAAQHQSSAAAEMSNKKPKDSILDKLFGALQDTCESNFDCERPEVCCDFGFTKKCCMSGSPVIDLRGQPAYVPVPVDVNFPGDNYYDRRRNY
jgi:hypothetical protein